MTGHDGTNQVKKQSYGLFAAAATLYVVGVLAISTWSYLESRSLVANETIRDVAIIEGMELMFLLAMAIPLMGLYVRAKTITARRMAALNDQLQRDYSKMKAREVDLEDAIRDLQRFNAVAVGRESRIIELKAEVNSLLEQLHQEKRYTVTYVD